MLIRRAYVDIAAGQIHLRQVDGAGPPIVLLHRVPSSSAMFESVLVRLSGLRAAFAIDLPGFGGSFDPDAPFSLEDHARSLIEVLARLGHEQVHLVGHHTGGSVGLCLARLAPERLRSLTLSGPVVFPANARAEFLKLTGNERPPRSDGEHWKAIWHELSSIGADRDLALHHREAMDAGRAWRSRASAFQALWAYDPHHDLRSVACPLHFISSPGDIAASALPAAVAERPDASLFEVAGGELCFDFSPDELARQLIAICANADAETPALPLPVPVAL